MHAMLMKIFPANASIIGQKLITRLIFLRLENVFNDFPQPEGEILSTHHCYFYPVL